MIYFWLSILSNNVLTLNVFWHNIDKWIYQLKSLTIKWKLFHFSVKSVIMLKSSACNIESSTYQSKIIIFNLKASTFSFKVSNLSISSRLAILKYSKHASQICSPAGFLYLASFSIWEESIFKKIISFLTNILELMDNEFCRDHVFNPIIITRSYN